MGNCLKTQLKESVQNENLSKLNELKVSIPSLGSQQVMYVKGIERVVAYGDGYFSLTNGGEHKTDATIIPSNLTALYIPEGIEFKLGLYSKYELITLSGSSLNEYKTTGQYNLSDVKYCTELQYLTITGIGDIKDLANNTELINLCIGNGATGDIAHLSGCTKLSTFNCNESDVYGRIDSISSMIKLNNIGLINTRVTGKVEDFVAAQILATRTTGNINWQGIMKNLSFGNMPAGSGATQYAPYYLKWESASKIWIEGVLSPHTNNIWCMGYTQSEAETKWSGKNIATVDNWNDTGA